jgi:hypothetical protein
MKIHQTPRTNAKSPASPAQFEAPSARPARTGSQSTRATDGLMRAAEALHEAAIHIEELEARVQSLEAEVRAFSPARALPVAQYMPLGPQSSSAIDADNRTHVDTSTAARWLNRHPQTLRKWACYEDGPLRPIRVNSRLAWAVADIRRVLHSGSTAN